MFEGLLSAMVAFFVLAMVSAGSMNYSESSIKEDCEKIGYFHIQDKVYKCEAKK